MSSTVRERERGRFGESLGGRGRTKGGRRQEIYRGGGEEQRATREDEGPTAPLMVLASMELSGEERSGEEIGISFLGMRW
jgi:hypothetical protein